MKPETLRKEVREVIEARLNAGDVVQVGWLTLEMLNRKKGISGEDKDFYLVCATEHLSRVIRSVIGKYEPSIEQDRQLVLEGFEHLQTGYLVERENERVVVPTDQCSDEELMARADEYDEMARGCQLHAQEIRAYVRARRAAA